jgi:UDP-N-acetylglucosamine diphosphorylase/glucosamine-1-phosphate N-acetyltransferase
MSHSILLVEAENAEENLYPFSVMHCAWEVRIGAFKKYEKIQREFPDACLLYFTKREKHLRSFLKRVECAPQQIGDEDLLVLKTNALHSRQFWNNVQEALKHYSTPKPILFKNGEEAVAAFIPKSVLAQREEARQFGVLSDFSNAFYANFETESIEIKELNYLWNALDYVEESIEDDFKLFKNSFDFSQAKTGGYFCCNEKEIYIGEGAKIAPGVILDATDGPIIIGANAKIMANSVLIGPCFIGDNSIIKIGAKIYEKTVIGEWCKVGGEVENSIIHAYSNKQHDGFLGHSYLGEWVNLGADTNTSDLKNTYGKISALLRDKEINSERMFLGLLAGDHTKSGINTMFTTGTVAGVSSNVVGAGYPPRSIPSFSFGGFKDSPVYEFQKAIDVAKTVMARRKRELLPEEEALLKMEFERLAK